MAQNAPNVESCFDHGNRQYHEAVAGVAKAPAKEAKVARKKGRPLSSV